MPGTLHILGRDGDTRVSWAGSGATELAGPRELFRRHLERGFVAYRTWPDGGAEVITEFDPDAETIVLRPPMAGG